MIDARREFFQTGATRGKWLHMGCAGVLLGVALYGVAWCATMPFGTVAVLMLATSALTACLALCAGE